MRLTTTSRRSTAAIAATAGLAILLAGCSSSEPTAAPVVHHAVKAEPAADKAKKVSPRKQLAKAMRTSLAARSVTFRERITARYVDPDDLELGLNRNPLQAISGTANFATNTAMFHLTDGPNASQPKSPLVTVLQKGRKVYAGSSQGVNAGRAWQESTATANIDELVDVLSNTKGKVRLVRENARFRDGATGMKLYETRIDLGRSLLDSGAAENQSLGRQLLGETALQRVWVDGSGRIARIQAVLSTARVPVPGVDASVVKAVVVTLRLTNYGVDLFVPPHPTEV